ncbi:MAG: hypothetical protein ABI615_01070 [Chthoniobacterales bacterium]
MLLLLTGSLFAEPSYTFNLTAQAQSPLPGWLDALARTKDDATGVETLSIPITPPPNSQHLAVTLIYREKQHEKLTVRWQAHGDSKPFTLTKETSEELNGVKNQKTLILEKALIDTGGTLLIDYSSQEIAPSKIALDWVEPNTILAQNQEEAPALISSSGKQITTQALAGIPFVAEEDKIGSNVVDATLIGKAESFDEPLQVEATLDAPVQGARIAASIIGVPFNVGVSIYVNDHHVGEMQMETPGLDDPGYDFEDGNPVYAGWRKGTIIVPRSYFKQNENKISFVPTSADQEAVAADFFYIRDARIQLIYAETP